MAHDESIARAQDELSKRILGGQQQLRKKSLLRRCLPLAGRSVRTRFGMSANPCVRLAPFSFVKKKEKST